MEKILVKGDVYTVATKSECTITSANGTPLGTATVEAPYTFTATTDRVVLSDPDAEFARVNPKYAPVKLRLLGLLGGGELYPGFDLKKYATCKTRDDVVAINPDYINDLTDDGRWVYPMPEMTRFANDASDWWSGFFYKSPIKKIKAVFPKVTYCHAFFGGANKIEEADLEYPSATRVSALYRQRSTLKKLRIIAPLATSADGCFYWSQVKNPEWYVYYPKATNCESMFSNCIYHVEIKGEFGAEATNLNSMYNKCSMLRVFPTNYPKAQTADGMFNECQIPGEAAIAVLNSFPSYTSGEHNVTMGVHVDYQNDTDVLVAIANAEAKGWTVAVQWNGTATTQTASTWGLRRKPVYAKCAEVEQPDGTVENVLEWGHYVTNWELNGYMEFGSIEEAREYFNLTEI